MLVFVMVSWMLPRGEGSKLVDVWWGIPPTSPREDRDEDELSTRDGTDTLLLV